MSRRGRVEAATLCTTVRTLRPGCRAWPVAKVDQFVAGLLQAESVSQGRRQQQVRIGDRTLVIERDLDLLQVQLDSVQAGV